MNAAAGLVPTTPEQINGALILGLIAVAGGASILWRVFGEPAYQAWQQRRFNRREPVARPVVETIRPISPPGSGPLPMLPRADREMTTVRELKLPPPPSAAETRVFFVVEGYFDGDQTTVLPRVGGRR